MAVSVPASPEGWRSSLAQVPHWCPLCGLSSCSFAIGLPIMMSSATKHLSPVWKWFLGSLYMHPSWDSNLPISVFQKWNFCKLKYFGRQRSSLLCHQHHAIQKYTTTLKYMGWERPLSYSHPEPTHLAWHKLIFLEMVFHWDALCIFVFVCAPLYSSIKIMFQDAHPVTSKFLLSSCSVVGSCSHGIYWTQKSCWLGMAAPVIFSILDKCSSFQLQP